MHGLDIFFGMFSQNSHARGVHIGKAATDIENPALITVQDHNRAFGQRRHKRRVVDQYTEFTLRTGGDNLIDITRKSSFSGVTSET